MPGMLVHVVAGPQDPTRAALGMLIALTALEEGQDVTLFLAGDAVHLLAPAYLHTVEGVGTGRISDHVAGLKSAGARLLVSGKSALARGYDEALLEGFANARFALPPELVAEATSADTVLCY